MVSNSAHTRSASSRSRRRVARRSTWLATIAKPSPALSAAAVPYVVANVGRPRRISLPSAMSSWTRKALCISSIATAMPSRSCGLAPKARPADRHSAGRNALPGRDGYSRIGA